VNVLDIDLDFFLNRRLDGRSDDPNKRPDDDDLIAWSAADVTAFLEGTLNIRKSPGAIVQSHDEVFYHWRNLIDRRELAAPFRVVHVDAHSDLGMGFPSWAYLHSEFLSMSISERPNAKKGDWGVNFGSFLAFAFGCRWISQADFVINRNWHDDIPRTLLSQKSHELVEEKAPNGVLPYGGYELEVELMQTPIWDPMTSLWDSMEVRKPIGEPRVPFNIIPAESVGDRHAHTGWDYIFLSHSPGYVPRSADHLLDHIGEYIT
jgi:hypothetical protein